MESDHELNLKIYNLKKFLEKTIRGRLNQKDLYKSSLGALITEPEMLQGRCLLS